jgi:hypothetical protein
LNTINHLAKARDKDAVTYLSPDSTPAQKQAALYQLSFKGKLSGDYKDGGTAEALTKVASQLPITEAKGTFGEDDRVQYDKSNKQTLLDNLKDVTGNHTIDESIEMLTLSTDIRKSMLEKGVEGIDSKKKSRFEELAGVKDLTPQELQKRTGNMVLNMGRMRISHLVGLGKVGDATGLEKKLKAEMGGMALSGKIDGNDSDAGVRASLTQQEAQRGNYKERSGILKLQKEGWISPGEAMAAITGLDNKETVGKFSSAVEMFAKSVGAMPDGGTKGGTKSSSWWPDTWSLNAANRPRPNDIPAKK